MASMRDIKRRKLSIQSTQQITKAMKLVATAKLQKAKLGAQATRPMFNKMRSTIASILDKSDNINHPYLTAREVTNKGYVVITSNRGLAGGYNSNVCKLVFREGDAVENAKILAVGRKGRDILKRRGYTIEKEYHEIVEEPLYRDAMFIGARILKMYTEGLVDEVYIAYTAFNSSINQEPKLLKILPVDPSEFEGEGSKEKMNYEPSPEAVLEHIIPKYINSIIFGAMKESVASEHGARMTAMDSATNNANDMIDDLTLAYNRARQASITQEISEIVGGAEALK